MDTSDQKLQSTAVMMTPGDEKLMRLTYLVRRTCDQLSRDLMTHTLLDLHSTDWDTFANDPNCRKDFMKYFKHRFVDRIPSLTECDTTVLYDFFKRVATYPPFAIKSCVKFDDKMETIKRFRNNSAHFTNMQLSDQDYDTHFSEFVWAISKFETSIFVSLNDCLKFLTENKYQTFAHFCRNNPEEIALVLSTFEKNLLVMAKEIKSLKAVVEKIEADNSRKLQIESRIDDHQDQTSSNGTRVRLPKSNLIRIPKLAGRDDDLKAMADCFKRSQIVNICGPPGIGKTSLALKFANDLQTKGTYDNASASIECSYLYVKLAEICTAGVTDKQLKNKIGKQIGALFPDIATDIFESEIAFELLMTHFRGILNETHLFFVLDNVETVLHVQQENVMGIVLEDLASLDESVRILTTSRDRSLNTNLTRIEMINLKPVSQNDCDEWLKSENLHSNLSDELISAIAEDCDGIPLILMIMHSVALRRRDFSADNLDEIKRSGDWNRLTRSFDKSFKRLTPDQVKLMKCASVFGGHCEKLFLIENFQKLGGDYDCGVDALSRCSDLNLIEFDFSNSRYYLHHYIKEYIKGVVVDSTFEIKTPVIEETTSFHRFFKNGQNCLKKIISVSTHESNSFDNFAEEHPVFMFFIYAMFVFFAYQLKCFAVYLAND